MDPERRKKQQEEETQQEDRLLEDLSLTADLVTIFKHNAKEYGLDD